ncbi:hypothetical protein NDU88_003721 [Pleurodeles waltl]|uniref:Uncharacterized protein n=1 Tax=Pleurodeles waltl TaxID=8319 RepID=A0AAV7WTL7_PLEWA|nr:hypothetical protein NDU88_003721 [Pleurodeles waltl]
MSPGARRQRLPGERTLLTAALRSQEPGGRTLPAAAPGSQKPRGRNALKPATPGLGRKWGLEVWNGLFL